MTVEIFRKSEFFWSNSPMIIAVLAASLYWPFAMYSLNRYLASLGTPSVSPIRKSTNWRLRWAFWPDVFPTTSMAGIKIRILEYSDQTSGQKSIWHESMNFDRSYHHQSIWLCNFLKILIQFTVLEKHVTVEFFCNSSRILYQKLYQIIAKYIDGKNRAYVDCRQISLCFKSAFSKSTPLYFWPPLWKHPP